MSVQMTIVGLRTLGASFGLALGEHEGLLARLGHDPDPGWANKAKKLGAIDRVAFNLPRAVEQADIVLLSLPMNEVKSTLQVIAPELKEGAVVIDLSPVKRPVIAWAEELLHPGRYLVGLTPIVGPLYLQALDPVEEQARVDLFQDGLMAIVTPPGTVEAAVKLATDLVRLVGAKPMYAGADEVDGLMAALDLLPRVLAAALVQATVDQPGWQDGRKIAGQAYSVETALLQMGPSQSVSAAAMLNRENVLRAVDRLGDALNYFRQLLEEGDEIAIGEWVADARERRQRWWHQKQTGVWDSETPPQEYPSMGEILGRLVGLGRKTGKGRGERSP